MTELISIKDCSKHVDEKVKMHVWLTDKRSSGKSSFSIWTHGQRRAFSFDKNKKENKQGRRKKQDNSPYGARF